MTDLARWKATVYVGGLTPMVTAANLHDAFVPFGEIAEVSLPKNENPNAPAGELHRGFAYVEFEDAEDAKDAINNMDQAEIFGRIIKVSAAREPKSKDQGLGSRKALWEQESWLAENAVSEEDRLAPVHAEPEIDSRSDDRMQSLEGLDAAGPKPA